MLIEKDKSSLIIVDVQEKLVSAMRKPHTFIDNIIKLQRVANILKIPITISEQYPKGLGNTIEKIKIHKYKINDGFRYMLQSCYIAFPSKPKKENLKIRFSSQLIVFLKG